MSFSGLHIGELIGYLAAVLVVLAYYTKTMVPLRIIGLCSNCAFIIYGYLETVYPTLVLHAILLPLNSVRLRQMLQLTREVRKAVHGDLNMDWLKPFSTTRRVKKGEVLFRRSDTANAMFFIVSGRCKLSELGVEVPPGQIIGELGLLAPDQLRTQSLEFLEDGKVLEISYGSAKQLYYQNPQFGFYFLQLVTRRLFQNNATLEQELVACKAMLTQQRQPLPQSP